MTGAPAHVSIALEAQKALNSDDGRGAVLPRRHMSDHVVGASAQCPDPLLWASFQTLARAWAHAIEPVIRARYSGALEATSEAIIRLDAETRMAARLRALDRQRAMTGLPVGDG